MTQVDVRQLQHHLGRYLDAVEAGEVLEVRRRRRVIARVVPFSPAEPSEAWPDLVERLNRLYPEGPIAESASEHLYSDRDSIDSSPSN
jgi:antitoxin (DNA-binding transcriptional repressor) of toxin-antitoxin stability system